MGNETTVQISRVRPWRQVFDISTFLFPSSYSESMSRLRRNASYFQINYALALLLVLFCSLLFHPLSLVVFLLVSTLWLPLLFLRGTPVLVLGRPVSQGAVMAALGLVTVLGLVCTGVGGLVFWALLVGVVVVGVHAVLRGVDDLFLGEDEAAEGGLLSVVGARINH